MSRVSHLECSVCSEHHAARAIQTVCVRCGAPLLVRYELTSSPFQPSALPGMWRYQAVLPVEDPANIVTLGEGSTPMLHARRLGAHLGMNQLWIKDEGVNPTASFKARGLACAVSMAVELGLTKLAIPSAGNAAGAMAAYAARAGLEAHIFMPRDVPQANYLECEAAGARVTLVDGLISDCAKAVAARKQQEGWFDVSTLKEPYRIEGKKTMGYEVAEQLNWTLPDAIFYPAGGGVGLIGMWKAFAEMELMGWVGKGSAGPQRPKMIAVQAEGCQPVVRAWGQGADVCEMWQDASTVASGLRVPKPFGDRLMLQALRESEGCAIAVTDRALIDGGLEMTSLEGVFAAPEGGACVAALRMLLESKFLKPEDRVVLFNTGSGLKYPEAYSVRFPRTPGGEADKLGGLITPR